jgi:hypothetical protein
VPLVFCLQRHWWADAIWPLRCGSCGGSFSGRDHRCLCDLAEAHGGSGGPALAGQRPQGRLLPTHGGALQLAHPAYQLLLPGCKSIDEVRSCHRRR